MVILISHACSKASLVPLILTSIAPDADTEQFAVQDAAATLAAPVTLGALNVAVQTVTRKEYA